MQFVGMVKPSTVKRGFLRRLLREVEEHGEKKLEYAGFDRILGDPDYHLLRQLTTLDVGQMLKRYLSKLHLHGSDDHVGAPLQSTTAAPCHPYISGSSPPIPSAQPHEFFTASLRAVGVMTRCNVECAPPMRQSLRAFVFALCLQRPSCALWR